MKHLFIVLLVIFAIVLISCGKKDDAKKKSNLKDELVIVYTNDYQNNFAAIMTDTKSTSKSAVDFDLRYQTISEYELRDCTDKVLGYPCRLYTNDDSEKQINVFLPNKIKIFVEFTIDKESRAIEWNDYEKLKSTIPEFDIEGLLKLSGDTIKGTELVKYFPKLDKRQ